MIWKNVIETCIIYMKLVASQKKKKKNPVFNLQELD